MKNFPTICLGVLFTIAVAAAGLFGFAFVIGLTT